MIASETSDSLSGFELDLGPAHNQGLMQRRKKSKFIVQSAESQYLYPDTTSEIMMLSYDHLCSLLDGYV